MILDNTAKPPLVTLNGEPVTFVGSFAWGLVNGVESPEYTVLVSASTDEVLRASKGPLTLKLQQSMIGADPGAPNTRDEFTFKVYAVERRPVEPYIVQWLLVDERWRFRHFRMSLAINLPGASYELDAQGGSSVGDVNTFRMAGIIAATAKEPTDAQYTVPELGAFSGEPWTIKDVVQWLFNAEGGFKEAIASGAIKKADIPTISIAELGPEGDVQAPALFFQESRLPDILREVLAFARCALYLDSQGIWVFHSLLTSPFGSGEQRSETEEGAQMMALANLSRNAPNQVNVRFPSIYEILFIHDEASTSTAGVTWRLVENVVQLPDEVQAPSGIHAGRLYRRGEWVTISEALTAWGTDWSTGRALTVTDIRQIIHSRPRSEQWWIGSDGSQLSDINTRRMQRLMALEQHWRLTFRIPRFILDHLMWWDVTRVQVLDPVSGTRVASPVWADHCIVRRSPLGQTATTNTYSHNVSYSDNEQILLSRQFVSDVAPFRARVVEPADMGIFRIEPDAGSDARVAEVLRCPVDRPYSLDPLILEENGVNEATDYSARYRMRIILSVRFRPAKFRNVWTTVKVPAPKDLKDLAVDPIPCVDVVREDTPAMYEWSGGKTETGIDEPTVTDANLTNREVLEAHALDEAARTFASYIDRPIGVFTYRDFNPERDRPRGFKSAVEWRLDDSGAFGVFAKYPEMAIAQDMRAIMDPEMRRVIYREAHKVRR